MIFAIIRSNTRHRRVANSTTNEISKAKILRTVSDLTSRIALKYLHRTAYLIVAHLGPKWMGKGLLQQPGYMERVRAGFQKRRVVPYVSLCVDGSLIPYKPNSGDDEQAFMNYKQLEWTSLLCVGYINSLHLSVDMAECMPKHAQITTIFGAHNTCA